MVLREELNMLPNKRAIRVQNANVQAAIECDQYGGLFMTINLTGPDYTQTTGSEYLVLLFGLSLIPFTFTKCVEAELAPSWERDIHIQSYPGDWALKRGGRGTDITTVVCQTFKHWVFLYIFRKVHTQTVFFPRTGSMLPFHPSTSVRVAVFNQCVSQFQLERKLCVAADGHVLPLWLLDIISALDSSSLPVFIAFLSHPFEHLWGDLKRAMYRKCLA